MDRIGPVLAPEGLPEGDFHFKMQDRIENIDHNLHIDGFQVNALMCLWP